MNDLIKIINDWQNYIETKKLYQRDILNDINLDTNEVIDILGCRRVGKSSTFKLIIEKLKLSKNEYLYINFEDPYFIENSNYNIIEELIEVYLEYFSKDLKYLFFDEIQNITNWERIIRKLRDLEKYKIFISGSSSKLLSKELGTSLTGRHLSYTLYPLSFKEYLNFNKIKINSKKDLILNKIKIEKYFDLYLKNGGFPEVTLKKDLNILKNYFYDILYKDIVSRYEIRDINNLEKLTYYTLSNFTSFFSLNSIKKQFQISFDKIRNYLHYLTEPYLIFELKLFDYSYKKQEMNPKKYYVIDNGFITSSAFKFSEDFGKLLENLVFIELKRQNKEIYYYKTKNGYEIDFLVKNSDSTFDAFQVSYNLENKKTKDREIRSFINSNKELKIKNFYLITRNHNEEILLNGIKIQCISIINWLLYD